MNLEIFAVYDQKAQAYLPPFFVPTTGMGQRMFANCIQEEGHPFNLNPSDYTLYHIGSFEDSTAELTPRDRTVLQTGLEVAATLDNEIPIGVVENGDATQEQPAQE